MLLRKLKSLLTRAATRLVIESAVVGIASYVGYGCLFVFSLLLNRYSGTTEFGRFSLAVAVSQLAISSLSSGFSAILRRDVSRDRSLASTYVANFLLIRFATVGLAGVMVWATFPLYWGGDSRFSLILGYVFAAKALDAISEIFESLYQAFDRMRLYSITVLIQNVPLVAMGLWTVLSHKPIFLAYVGYFGTSVATLVFNIIVVSRLFVRIKIGADKVLWRYTVGQVWPLLVNALAMSAYARIILLILSHFQGTEAVGVYTAGMNVVNGLSLLSGAVGTVVFPLLCRTYKERPWVLLSLMRKIAGVMSGVGAVVAAALALGAPIVVSLYGRMPPGSVSLLRVLSLGLIPVYAQTAVGYMFTAIDRQFEGMLFAIGMTAVNLLLSFYLVPLYGLTGAAVTYIAVVTVWFATGYLWLSRRHLHGFANRLVD